MKNLLITLKTAEGWHSRSRSHWRGGSRVTIRGHQWRDAGLDGRVARLPRGLESPGKRISGGLLWKFDLGENFGRNALNVFVTIDELQTMFFGASRNE